MEFIIATNNQKKLEELDRILRPLGITAVSAKEKGVILDDVEETGTTFSENAFLKAKAAVEKTGLPAIADDSGLCVDALDGRPGVFSARYGGEDADYLTKIALLLKELDGIKKEDRTAHFTCSVCCLFPDGDVIRCEGYCNGSIAFSPSGDGGFGYDPIFLVGEKSFASLSSEEKDRVSHRGNALRELKAKLSQHDYIRSQLG